MGLNLRRRTPATSETEAHEALDAELALLREENVRLRLEAARLPEPGRAIDRLRALAEAGTVREEPVDEEAADGAWQVLGDTSVVRETLAALCEEIQGAIGSIQQRLAALAPGGAAEEPELAPVSRPTRGGGASAAPAFAPAFAAARPVALRPVPDLAAQPDPEAEPLAPPTLLELQRLVEAHAAALPERAEEQRLTLFYLRDFADATGHLPAAFGGLVEKVFGELLNRRDLR